MDHHREFLDMQSPDIELILPNDELEVDLTTPPRAHKSYEDNEEALHIKPPPPNASKRDKHKHKHKEDRKRDRDRDKDRSRHGDRERERSTKHRDRQEKERTDMYEKERDRDHRRKEVEELEAEAKRREKSQLERDRLERLERERRKLEREAEREQREREHREKMRQEQERLAKAEREQERLQKAEREQQRYAKAEREKERMMKSSRSDRSHRRDDADSRKKTHSTRQDIEKRRDREKDRRRERRVIERSRSRSPRESRDSKKRYKEHYDSHQRQEYKHMDHEDEVTHHDDRHDQHDEHVDENLQHDLADDLLEDIYEHQSTGTIQEPIEEASSVSSSDSESEDSDTDSESESEPEESVHSHKPASPSEPESAEENEHQEDVRSAKLYGSKFDDDLPASEVESVPESEPEEPPTDDEDYLEQTPPESPIELAPQLPVYLPAIQGCRNVEEFHCLNRIEEGTYGVVYRARDNKTDELVALKRLKMEKEKEGFPITSLREINTLLKSQHPNIVTVREIVVGSNMDKIYIVMDYVEHDLKSLMQSMKDPFIIGEVKTLMQQLLRGVAHLHDNWIIHRDLKTSNLLLSHNGILKIGDFGLAREYGSPLKPYTSVVVTLWYRSPELLLGIKEYSTYIDMWSVGCIFAEFLNMKPLFPGKSEIDELNRIFKELGTPNEKIWPGVSQLPVMKKCTFAEYPYNQLRNRFSAMLTDKGFDLMNRFLAYDPARRVTAKEALPHHYFNESPMPVPPSMFPTWPAKSEQAARTHGNTPRPPSGGKAYDKLLGDDDDEVLERGFRIGANARGPAASTGFSLKF